jgi:putative mRNA 3-end processing factor
MLLGMTPRGLECALGGFHVDPARGVETAVITHAHSDHARRGSARYLCARGSRRLLELRLGGSARIEEHEYGVPFRLGAVAVSFHPAGHILGSAQVRVEDGQGEVWVVSGDFKREPDPTCAPFEVVRCSTFITESTFAHPRYAWGPSEVEIDAILDWWETNRRAGVNSLLYCYSLGKTQRVLGGLFGRTQRRALLFGEANAMTACYRAEGVALLASESLEEQRAVPVGELVIAPHSIARTHWLRKLGPDVRTAFASGWMQGGGGWGRAGLDRGFALSDHADWAALVATARETGASRVLIQDHGPDAGSALARHLMKLGVDARLLSTRSARARGADAQGDLFASAGIPV